MKYIVCGLEHIGLRITEALLDLNEEVTLITLNKNEASLFFVRNKVTNYVEGDARCTETLKLAGIEKADYFLIFTSDEIKNIEINCKAKELNPEVKTALLIKSLSYAKIVEQGFHTNYVFHLPSIVSFPIASSCIDRNILYIFNNDKNSYYLGSVSCSEIPDLCNKTAGEIENIYKIKIVACPGNCMNFTSTTVIKESTTLIYLTADEFPFSKGNSNDTIDLITSESSQRYNPFRAFSISHGIKQVIGLYAILILLSVLVFKLSLGLSIIDAFYFVVTTTTTVGYGDFNLQNSPFWIKLYGCFVMLAGAALLATLFSVLTDSIISKRLGKYANFYNRKIKDHIIVAGIGSIGLSVVNCLQKLGVKTVVIEKDPDNPNIHIFRSKVPVLIGDASEEKILLKAGVKKAKTLAALIDNDLNNLNIILKGNNLNSNLHTVGRVFSNELHKKAEATFNIDNVIGSSIIAVPYIICSLVREDILWAGYIHGKIFSFYKFKIDKNLVNKNRHQLNEEFKLYPALIEQDGIVKPIHDELIFKKEDQIYAFIEYETLKTSCVL